MITKTITLIRHGESEGNVDKSIYRSKPDYALRLTQKGFEQAVNLGKEIRNLHDCEFIGMEPGIYCSPFWRARDTLQGLKLGLGKGFNPRYIYEDSRLREQEWGGRMGCDFDYNVEKERDSTGHYYYRFQNGESCADVENRISSFLNTLWRDMEEKEPANVFIICHGMTMRVFLKRWLHLTVEEFERMKNPPNCSRYVLEREPYTSRFDLKYGFGYELHETPKNQFQYNPFIVS